MKLRINFWTVLLLFVLFTAKNVSQADESTTKAPQTNTTTVAPTTIETTAKPKINISESSVCKKCFCDIDNHQLDCSNRQLKTWFSDEEWSALQNGDHTFDIIDLRYNNLTDIPKLPAYPVAKLYLSFNSIETIAIDAFQDLTVLAKLDLSQNKLTSKVMVPDIFRGQYSANDFLPIETLVELNLGYNELHNLDADLFEHLPKLETLILCKNTFQIIDQSSEIAIAGLTSLKTLDLSYMELSDLPESFLHGPRDLETLILSGNMLKKIPDNLALAINLKELVLDENLIAELDGKNVFPEMKNLEYLSISYMNDLTRIGPKSLSELQKLKVLIASNNPKLSEIDVKAFTKNTTNPEIFDYPPLEKLYLHNNNLSTLDRGMVQRWDKITVIDLRFNNWTCDYTNDWLINILMVQINASTPLLTKDVVCGEPTNLRSLSLMSPRVKEVIANKPMSTGAIVLVIALVSLLVGVPIIIGTVVIYRRGCFGIFHRRTSPIGAHYSRAESAEDLHI